MEEQVPAQRALHAAANDPCCMQLNQTNCGEREQLSRDFGFQCIGCARSRRWRIRRSLKSATKSES